MAKKCQGLNMLETKLQVGVKVLLKNKEGKFLLVHRSRNKYPEKENPWDIVGGRINPGETLINNLAREVKEEIGLNLVSEPKLVAAQDILREDNVHIVRLTYLGEAEGEVKLDIEENDQHEWFTWTQIESMQDELNKYLQAILIKLKEAL